MILTEEQINYIKEYSYLTLMEMAKYIGCTKMNIQKILDENNLCRNPILYKLCPICKNKQYYKSENNKLVAIKKNIICKKCMYERRNCSGIFFNFIISKIEILGTSLNGDIKFIDRYELKFEKYIEQIKKNKYIYYYEN